MGSDKGNGAEQDLSLQAKGCSICDSPSNSECDRCHKPFCYDHADQFDVHVKLKGEVTEVEVTVCLNCQDSSTAEQMVIEAKATLLERLKIMAKELEERRKPPIERVDWGR